MVKTVIGEETQLNLAETRISQSAIPAQVGLVIGKLSSDLDRGFVYDLIPTPQNDAGEPACSLVETNKEKRKASKSKSQPADSSFLAIDSDWVAEHARQVSRMLLGGMKVVGIYVWASDNAYKNSTMVLCQTIKGVAEASPFMTTDLDERLLIHICYSPRRWTCRSCALTSNITSSSLRPSDFKVGKVLNSLQRFRCTYNFDIRLPILNGGASNYQTLSEILRQGIAIHAKELRGARAVIDGKLVIDNEPRATDSLHEVELFLPFMKDRGAEACSLKDVAGILLFRGSVSSYAYLNSKEPVSQAVAEIKGDIIRSLQSRLDIICDEAVGELVSTDYSVEKGKDEILSSKPTSQLVLHLSRKTCSVAFPRRVFVPWLAGIFICDYLQQSESLEVLNDHCVELMSMVALPDASTILDLEVEAPSLITKSFWDVVLPFFSATSSSLDRSNTQAEAAESSRKSGKKLNFHIMLAVFFLFVSIIIGYVLYVRGNGI